MANLTPLRNIYLSGGLFTENLLLKVRDKKDQIPEVQWITFGEKWQEEKKRYYEIWDWAKRLFGEIADKLDSWTIEERFEKWIKPLLQKLGHQSKPIPLIDLTMLSEEEQDNILNRIQVTHQLKNHAKIGLQICDDDNFDKRNDINYQKKSQHDHFQRFILLNEGIRWGLLSNGKHVRLLGEYSNIYAKGYIQFNLDSIFINKDESEFWVFYALIHHSRFNETYGLNPDVWIDKLKKKWKDLSKKLSSEDADINSNIISEGILNLYNKILNEFIYKANEKGVLAIKMSDSEIFMQNLKEKGLDLGEIGRDFYLKELDSAISDINENLSIIQRLQERSQEEGIEAGKKLRENVKKALELMGEGLINSSKAFTGDILKGKIEMKDFYQELLRITYRIIFVLYAESKDLLPSVATIYYNDLGLTYIRKKAQQPIRDDQNTDLWYRLLLLFKYLDIGESSLGINAFSGELFNPERIPLILDEEYSLSLSNSTLLKIIYELTIVDFGIGLQLIDYSEIGEEEIGSIYEALLDFQPRYRKKDSPTYHFILEEIDTERKGTGTYYTPKGLIDILLKTSLKPVIENKLLELESKEEKLKAILELKICDPACGGGSFLLASIDYLGKIYAQIESEQEFPEEIILRESRRAILQHCIYGVDFNLMALELAKISLWLKAAVKDKPLTFLDNHLKEGNSLIGFTKKKRKGKIPLNAFNVVKGNIKTGIPDENRTYLTNVKKKAKDFSVDFDLTTGKTKVQKTLFPYKDSEKYSDIAFEVFKMDETSLENFKEKKKCYLKLKDSNSWKNLNFQANLWTSSFFWNMGKNHIDEIPTDTVIFNLKQGNVDYNSKTFIEAGFLSKKFNFFNWHLEFPEVFLGLDPGFDVILMNPPWEVLTTKEIEFFSGKDDNVINTQNQVQRQKEIKKLVKTNSHLHNEFIDYYRKIKKESHYFRNCSYFPFSAKGSMNYFALFVERTRSLINQKGKVGCIVLSSILTGKNLSSLFQNLIESNSLESSFLFINEMNIFPGVLHNLQFCLLTITYPSEKQKTTLMSFNIWDLNKFNKLLENFNNNISQDETLLKTKEGGVIIPFIKTDFTTFNPNTLNSPTFKRIYDFTLTKKAYEKTPILIKRDVRGDIIFNPWNIYFKRLFDMAGDSKLFYTIEDLKKIEAKPLNEKYLGGIWIEKGDKNKKYVPLYAGSSVWFYDYRYNELQIKKDKSKKQKVKEVRVNLNKHQDPNYFYSPAYWIKEEDAINRYPSDWNHSWFLIYRRITSESGKRTFVVCPIPHYPSGDSVANIIFTIFKKEIICLIANLSSLLVDYIAKNKISGMNFAQFTVEQLPVFPPRVYNKLLYKEVSERAIYLIFTSWDMQNYAIDFGFPSTLEPFDWDLERREKVQAEIDAIFFMMYGYNKNETEYILNSFTVLRDIELKKNGEYKTKRLVLESYDKFNSSPKLKSLFNLEGIDFEKLKSD